MLKQYIINGNGWQFEEGTQPEGAVEVTTDQEKAADPVEEVAPVQKQIEEPENKAVPTPKNKAAKGSKK